MTFVFLCLVSRASGQILCSDRIEPFPADLTYRHEVFRNVGLELAGFRWNIDAQPWTADAAVQPGSVWLCERCLSIS